MARDQNISAKISGYIPAIKGTSEVQNVPSRPGTPVVGGFFV